MFALTPRRSPLATSLVRYSSAAAICAALLAATSTGRADTVTWSGATDGAWGTGTNWSGGAEPTAADHLLFPTPVPGTGSTITLGSGEEALALTFRDAYTLTGGSLALGPLGSITVAPTITATIASQLTGSNGLTLSASNGLTEADLQAGGGTLVLSGTNNYTGVTSVEAGTLRITNASALGAIAGGVADGTVVNGGTLEVAGLTLMEHLTLQGSNALLTTGTTALNGPLVLAADAGASVTGSLTVGGVISGAGGFTKSGAGSLTLTQANTFSGALNINGGTFTFSNLNQLGDGSVTNTLSVANGARIISSITSGDLGANRDFSFGAGTSTLEVAGTDLKISGVFSGAANGVLNKFGTGTLELTGTEENTNLGRLQVERGLVLLNKTGGVNAIGSGGLGIATRTANGGTSEVRLSGNNQIADNAPITMYAEGGYLSLFNLNNFTDTVGKINMSSTTTGSATITTGATGVLVLNDDLTLNNVRGATGNNSREVLITGTGTYGTIQLNGTLDLGGAAQRKIIVTGTNNIDGTNSTIETVIQNGGILKQGAHGLILRNNNTYSGGTIIENGAIAAYHPNALGTTGTIEVKAVGGTGELALGSGITFTRDVTVNGGILSGQGASSNFAGNITLAGSATVQLRDFLNARGPTYLPQSLTISGSLSGNGLLTVSGRGPGQLYLSGNNATYGGFVSVTDGATLVVGHSNALGLGGPVEGPSPTLVQSGGSLQLAGNITLADESIILSGEGAQNSDYARDGALRNLSGLNTIAQPITLMGSSVIQSDSGNLTLGNIVTLSPDPMDLRVRGLGETTFTGSLALNGGQLIKSGGGTLTFTTNQSAFPVAQFEGGTIGFTGEQSFGPSTVPVGLAYRFNSDPGTGVAVTVPAGARVLAGYAVDQALLSRLTGDSAGVLALRVDSASPLDFTAHPTLSLGAAGTNIVTYSGLITPGANGYLLGGGQGRLIVDSLLSGNNPLQVNGDVRLVGANTFIGDVTINSGGLLAVLDNTNLGAAGNVVHLNGGALQINEVSGSPTSLFMQLGNPLNPVDAPGARTIMVGAAGGRIDVPAPSSGANGFALTGVNSLQGGSNATLTKTELGLMYLLESNNFAGHLVVATNGNQVELRANGALPNVSSITLNPGGFLNVDNHNSLGSRQWTTVANDDRINDAAIINLQGGRLQYTAKGITLSGNSSREVFGEVVVGLGQSEVRAERAGGGGSDLVISELTREYGGGIVRFTSGNTGLGLAGDNGRIRISSLNGSGAEPTNGQFLGGWAVYVNNSGSNSDFATYLRSANGAAGGVVKYGSTGAPAYATTLGTGNIANFTGNVALPAGGASVGAIRLGQTSGTQAITFAAANDTFFIESGGFLTEGSQVNRTIGTSSVRGNLTAGLSAGSTAPQELFFNSNNYTITVYSNLIDNPGGGSLRVVKGLDGALTLDSGASNYSGGTYLLRGSINAVRAGSLGQGEVVVKNAYLSVGAGGATSGLTVPLDQPVFQAVDNSTIQLTFSSASTSGLYNLPGDRYFIQAGSTIYGNSIAFGYGLNSLTRVSAITGGGQIILEPDAIVEHNVTNAPDQGTGFLTINGLGTQADLYFAPAGTGNTLSAITVGGGTPWKGLSTDRSERRWSSGTIYANSDFYLQGLTRDNGTVRLVLGNTGLAGGFSIVNNAGKPIDAFIQGTVALEEDAAVSLPSDMTFVVMPGALFQPNRSANLGSGANVASVLVQAGGTLDPGSYTSLITTPGATYGYQVNPLLSPLNGNVTVRAGGRFVINDASGIGSAAAGSYLVKQDGVLEIGHPGAFRGAGDVPLGGTTDTGFITPGQFTFEPGAIVRLSTDNVQRLSDFVLDAPNGQKLVYEVFAGNRTLTQQVDPFITPGYGVLSYRPENFTVGAGGVLTNDGNDRQVNGGFGGRLILKDGATVAPTTQTIFSLHVATELEAGATVTVGADGSVDGLYSLGTLSFNGIQALIMREGSSFNLLNGTTLALSNAHVYPDTGHIDLPYAVTTTAANTFNLQPGTGTSLWLNAGGIETISKLTGVGRVLTNQSSGYLQVGYGLAAGDDFTFAGEFSNLGQASDFTSRNPHLYKIGESTMYLTGSAAGNTSTGNMAVYQGRIVLKDGGGTNFVPMIGQGGTLVLDNSGTALNNRLSGQSLNIGGGSFLLTGNATTPVTETLTQLNVTGYPGGRGYFNVEPANVPNAPLTELVFDTIQNFNTDLRATIILRGPGLAGQPGTYATNGAYTPSAGNPTNGLIRSNNPNFVSFQQTGRSGNLVTAALGTPLVPLRPDMLGSTDSASVWGDSFVTQDSPTTGFRVLAESEYFPRLFSNYPGASLNTRLAADSESSIYGDSRVSALTLGAGSTVEVGGVIPTTDSPSRLYFYSGAIMAQAGGASTITSETGFLDRSNNATWVFHTFGDLTLDLGVIGSNGFTKNGEGTLTFGERAFGLDTGLDYGAYGGNFWGGSHTINGGTVVYNDNVTFLRGQNAFGASNLVVNGGVANLNGHSQIFSRIDSNSPIAGTGGTITSATPATLTNYSGGTFSGHINGAITYEKFANSTHTLTSDNLYTGKTIIRNGAVSLVDDGSIRNTSGIDLYFGALRADDQGLNYLANRLPSNVTINSYGGTLEIRGRQLTTVRQDLAMGEGNAYNLLGGANTIRIDTGALGSTEVNIGNITRDHLATTLYFSASYGTYGTYGVDGATDLQNINAFFNLNGGAPTLVNDIIGGWAVVGSAFASYNPVTGVGEVGLTGGGFAATVGSTVSTWTGTQNAAFSGSASGNVTGAQELNSLRMLDNGSNPTLGFNAGSSLRITSGGIITSQNRPVTFGSTTAASTLTSGAEALWFWINGNSTTTINNSIVDDNGRAISLVKWGGATLQLQRANTYTGETHVNQGTLTLAVSGANGTSTVAVPGNLFLTGGNVTESAANQIVRTAEVTLNGGSTLTLRGGTAQQLSKLFFNNLGGGNSNNSPQVTAATTGGSLTLTATDAVTVNQQQLWATPTLSSNLGTVIFGGAAGTAQVIDVSGMDRNPLGMVFNASVGAIPTGVAGGGLVKTGNLMLALGGSGANQFGVPANAARTEVLNVQEGMLRVDHINALGNKNAVTTIQDDAVLLLRGTFGLTAGVSGSIILKDGATVSSAEQGGGQYSSFGLSTTDANALSTMTVDGNVRFFLSDYFLPVTQGYSMVLNSKLTGSGVITLDGGSGVGVTAYLQLANNLTGTANGANDFSGEFVINRGAILLNQPNGGTLTGSGLATASITLNGGELRLRDNGTGSNGSLAYGNELTILSNSTLSADRVNGANTGNLLTFGKLTLGEGVIDVVVNTSNSYGLSFAELDGPGVFRKENTGNIYLNGYSATSARDFVIMGTQGINHQKSQGLHFNAPVNNINSLEVGGNYFPLAGKEVNVATTLKITAETGVANGYNGVTKGMNGGALSIPNGATLRTAVLVNDGVVGSTGTGGAGLQATEIKGSGWYTTVGQQLTVTGRLNDPTGVFKVAGGVAAGDVVTLASTASAVINRVEVQSGTLRVAPTTAGQTPLGSNVTVLGMPVTTPGANSQAVNAPGGTLVFDTTTGLDIVHPASITNSGTIRVAGSGTTEIAGTISGQDVSYVPGLLEGRLSAGTLDTAATRAGNNGSFGIKLEPRMAQSNLFTGNALTGWEENTTWVYTGEFFDADGLFSFIENIDDRVMISIDGQNVLVNNQYNTVTSTAYTVGQQPFSTTAAYSDLPNSNTGTPRVDFGMGLNGDGWHTIEIRVVNGTSGGGAGTANGFGSNYGLGYNPDGATALDGSLYLRPIDPGDGSLFRTAVGGKGKVFVDAGSSLKVQGLTSMAEVGVTGGTGAQATLQLTAPGASDTERFTSASLGALNLVAGHTLTTQRFSVGANAVFHQQGAGTVRITTEINLAENVTMLVDAGRLEVGASSGASDSASSQVLLDGPATSMMVNGVMQSRVVVGENEGGALLEGVGYIRAIDMVNGILSPGNPDANGGLGSMMSMDVSLSANTVLSLQIAGTSSGQYDSLLTGGPLALDGELRLTLQNGFTPAPGNLFTIIQNVSGALASATGFGFSNAVMDPAFSDVYPVVFDTYGLPYLLSLTGGNGAFADAGQDVVLMAVVPEPSAGLTLLSGLALLGGLQRFRRRR